MKDVEQIKNSSCCFRVPQFAVTVPIIGKTLAKTKPWINRMEAVKYRPEL